MLVLVTPHSSAATFPVAGVDSVPPVPGRAGICALVDDDAGSRQRRAFSKKSIVSVLQQAHGVRLTHRSRRQKAAGRRACELQFALTLSYSGNGLIIQTASNDEPPLRGPRFC